MRDDRRPVGSGASGGLGLALATELAERDYDLVLAARSEAPMLKLAEQLSKDHGVDVVVETIDLAEQGSAAELVARLDARGISPAILVNNAGFGLSERFVAHDADRLRSMLNLNVMTLTELTRIIGGRMVERGSGHILLVASLAGYGPSPMFAAYAATKAYILSLGEALNVEMAPTVGVTVLSPGLMDTGFNATSGFKTTESLQKLVRPTDMVAKIGIDALFAREASVIAGRLNSTMIAVSRLFPRKFLIKQLRRRMARQ